MPAPESRSTPGASMSIAVVINAVRICAGVNAGFADLMSARSPPHAARPPRCRRTAGNAGAGDGHAVGGGDRVSAGLAAGRRKVARRDRGAVALEEDPARAVRAERLDVLAVLNGLGYGRGRRRGGDAERVNGGLVAAWPWVFPRVATDRLPRFVSRCRNRCRAGLIDDHDARLAGAVASARTDPRAALDVGRGPATTVPAAIRRKRS